MTCTQLRATVGSFQLKHDGAIVFECALSCAAQVFLEPRKMVEAPQPRPHKHHEVGTSLPQSFDLTHRASSIGLFTVKAERQAAASRHLASTPTAMVDQDECSVHRNNGFNIFNGELQLMPPGPRPPLCS